jgi:hypothetical protein
MPTAFGHFRFILAATLLFLLTSLGLADPRPAVAESSSLAPYAVVRIKSHGVSATVIWTGHGASYLLSCAHGYSGRDKYRAMAIDVPTPLAGVPKAVAIRLLAIDYEADLSLIEIGDGPLAYVCPVAPKGYSPTGAALSVGYDDMNWPAVQRPTHVLTSMTVTRERPWHGRSGGALIDERGFLIGVCSGYTGPRNHQEVFPGGRGLYVSHATIVRFLEREGWNFSQQTIPVMTKPNCPT